MSDLDRIKALAGLATDSVAEESVEREMKEPKVEDNHDEIHHDVEEAVGDAAEPIYDLIDMHFEGDCQPVFDDLVRYLSGDQIKEFVDDFRRHHELPMDTEESVTESTEMGTIGNIQIDQFASSDGVKVQITPINSQRHVQLDKEEAKELCNRLQKWVSGGVQQGEYFNEDDLEENAFNQAAAAAKRAGKSEFEFNGKKYKTTMDKSTAHQLDDDIQVEEFEDEELCDKCDMKKDECSCDHDVSEGRYDGPNSECCDAPLKNYNNGIGICSDCGDHAGPIDDEDELEEGADETLEESPTMDTTQFITLLRNAGLSEEAIETKITEWANTPEGVGEVDPTVHGGDDNYEFAQMVNLSLKKYLDAQDMKVQVAESEEKTAETLTEAYKNFKK